jgi:hypothetical protein
MIIEFITEVPIPGTGKKYRAGQRCVFERDRAERFIAQGQAREVQHLYREDEPTRIMKNLKKTKKQ